MLPAIKAISIFIERVSGVLIGVVTFIIILSALARYLSPYSVPDGYDFSRLLLGVSVFWGFAVACFRNDHIRVDLIGSILGPRLNKLTDLFSILVVVLFSALFCYAFYGTVEKAYYSGERTFDLGMPIWPAYAMAWLGVVMATFLGLIKFLLICLSGQNYEAVEHKTVAGGPHG